MIKNNFSRLAVMFWILICGAVGNSYAQKREIPKQWKEVKMCGLSLLIPKKLKRDKRFLSVDSCATAFKSKKMSLGLDYGFHTASFYSESIYPDTKRESLDINGKKALLATYSYGARIYILVGESSFGKFALGMTISGKNKNDVETARRIFQSILFVDEQK